MAYDEIDVAPGANAPLPAASNWEQIQPGHSCGMELDVLVGPPPVTPFQPLIDMNQMMDEPEMLMFHP